MPLISGTRPPQRARVVPNSIFAMMVLMFTEVMFFAALISAYLVIFSRQKSNWAPPAGIKLPVQMTAFNTGVLLASGIALLLASKRTRIQVSRVWLSAFLGGVFVVIQGAEWLRLIEFGMTIRSGTFSALFFLLVGTHVAHAIVGVAVVGGLAYRLGNRTEGHPRTGRDTELETLRAVQIFWGTIVCVWPVLYLLVYL